MFRSTTPLLALAMLLSAPAAPGGFEAAGGPLYFPPGPPVGASWRYYEFQLGGPCDTTAHVVTAVERRGGATTTSLGRREGGRVYHHRTLVSSADGLFLTEYRGRALDPPLCLLKLPHRHGQSWPVAWDESGERLAGTRTAYGPEEVKVMDRTYSAVRVETALLFGGRTAVLQKEWYAADLGLVMSRCEGWWHGRLLESYSERP